MEILLTRCDCQFGSAWVVFTHVDLPWIEGFRRNTSGFEVPKAIPSWMFAFEISPSNPIDGNRTSKPMDVSPKSDFYDASPCFIIEHTSHANCR